ncbi:MAG: hypothetical protein KF723_17635 [Rhizobiaceae bacterium]|nr:hypothetical protein [Rhizobiaceae bacterium]
MRPIATLLTALAIVAASGAIAQETVETPPPPVVDPVAGLAAWSKINAVFAHPRCAGCHVEDDQPRWSGDHYGGTRVHAFNVRRGEDGSGFGNPGLRCTTCHFESNSSVLHGPPGAPNWHLAPAQMAWWDKSSAQICAQIKDPERNGGRTLEEVAVHVRDDALVAWGWAPGPGREPAPGSAEATFQALQDWITAGSPCPQD